MKFIMTSPFGALEALREGSVHTGIDLAMPKGTPLRSIANGIVEKVTHYGNKNIGNGVVIKANDGSRMIYGHMDKVSIHNGDHVHPGTFLGTSGNSGNVFSGNGGNGAHLHFGLWKDGHYVDPSGVIEKVDAYAGSIVASNHHGILTDIIISKTREHAKQIAEDTILGTLDAIKEIALQTEYSVFLIATGILIVLRACGFKHPWIRPGVMMTLHVILKLLLGGFAI